MRVLIVEDETRLSENIAEGLREGAGYTSDVAPDGEAALDLLERFPYDLVLLDLMLPKLGGEQVLKRFRARNTYTPVLVLTAVIETEQTIKLLNAGADDYLTKPFDMGELIARSRAMIRRGKGVHHSTFQLGPLRVDTVNRAAVVHGTELNLSATEYRILEYLLHRPGVVLTRQELLEHLYDYTWARHSNVLEVHISNLRRKLRAGSSRLLLESSRGRGYRLSCIRGDDV